jgi:hypothetical protein
MSKIIEHCTKLEHEKVQQDLKSKGISAEVVPDRNLIRCETYTDYFRVIHYYPRATVTYKIDVV